VKPGASRGSIYRIARALRRRIVGSPPLYDPARHAVVAVTCDWGVLDRIDLEPSGRVLVTGWHRGTAPELKVSVNGEPARLDKSFELLRHDVVPPARGFGAEFEGPQASAVTSVVVEEAGRELARLAVHVPVRPPHYSGLYDDRRVLHRDDIYGRGPPDTEPNLDVLELARSLPAPLLDLGCGSGALIRALRSRGVEAYGIELQRPEIVASLRDDVKPWITLYAGGFPLPFADRRFRSVICSEVLEHIPDYAGAIREIARVAPEALITVPDMSAIPTLFPHGVVPWHLLEATHLNFFTQASLGAALGSVFRSVSFSRLGEFEVNGTRAFMNLVARCAA